MPKPNIQHFVVLMMENRSFDHIFGFRPGVNGLKGTESNLLNPASPASSTNPEFVVNNGAPFAIDLGQGPGHSVQQTNEQLFATQTPAKGQAATNDGFVQAYSAEMFADHVNNPPNNELAVVMESFAQSRLPSLTALADNFCLCDNWFSEVPGPTQPNRLYLHAATSAGWAHNVWKQQFNLVTIYENLQSKGLTWSTYEFDQNEVREFSRINKQTNCFKKYDAFKGDVQGGTLPNYCFIAPRFLNTSDGQFANDEHAPEDIRYGDNLIADVYETLRSNSAVWNQSVLIVNYDEHGGFYDHVAPPAAVNPDGINSPPPGDNASFAPSFAFDRLGLRVPTVIVSPWVGKGVVLSTQLQHTSILATAKEIFGLPKFLTKRDAAANAFTQAFSQAVPRTDAPQQLPRATLPRVTASPNSIRHPKNHPLDVNQQEMVLGVHHLTRPSFPDGLDSDELPRTQGEASDFIRNRYAKHFGPLAEAGAHLHPIKGAKEEIKAVAAKSGANRGKKLPKRGAA
ncbi:MAG TPA: alkaline phosphatase family protein [Terriglobales bacterium]|nr:alkaline phosphatase family protein [Terriglobales bacterium]